MPEDQFAAVRDRMVESRSGPGGWPTPGCWRRCARCPGTALSLSTSGSQAYGDYPLPIGEDQTISQPYIVALMTEILELQETDRVLEVGTGSGYQAAILAELAAAVFSIDRRGGLADQARSILDSLGYRNIHIRVGDGTLGWPEEAPFDGIIVTAGAPQVPRPLVEQLALGGRLVIPVGDRFTQTLTCVRQTREGLKYEYYGGCRFVRLIGKYGWDGGETEVGSD